MGRVSIWKGVSAGCQNLSRARRAPVQGRVLAGSRFFPVGRALQTGKGKERELILQYQTGIGSIKVNYGFQYTE